MGAGHRPHEQDDRHHRQARRHDSRGQGDLTFGMKQPAAGGREDEQKRPQQFAEQPAIPEPRVLELLPRAELQREPMLSPLLVTRPDRYRLAIAHVDTAAGRCLIHRDVPDPDRRDPSTAATCLLDAVVAARN